MIDIFNKGIIFFILTVFFLFVFMVIMLIVSVIPEYIEEFIEKYRKLKNNIYKKSCSKELQRWKYKNERN